MNRIREKIGRRKVILAILLIAVIAFSVVYALIQTRTGLAVLTTPPPGIPGPYYVTAEAKIYGPVVDLATIKSRMSGTYASDYSYVNWGTNPFYRVYVDNTFQEVYYGPMTSVMDWFSWGFPLESVVKSTYDSMKSSGAIDSSSVLGVIRYFGNMPGTYLAIYDAWGSQTLKTNTTSWFATYGHIFAIGYSTTAVDVLLNGSKCLSLSLTVYSSGSDSTSMNASGLSDGVLAIDWEITMSRSGTNPVYSHASVTMYLGNLVGMQTTVPTSAYKVYTVVDSPGTSFVSKYVSPSSTVAGSPINVTLRLDPPSAANVNITDIYPNTFTWGSVDVLLEKFKIGVGFEGSAYVNIVPVPNGSNMKFTVYYNQAPSILQSLLSDEYVYLTYSLRVPDTAGVYTLPAATMSYLIPTP